MAYCTTSDLYNQISETDLIALTDDAGAGVIDGLKITQAITDGDGEINAYLAGKYEIPVFPVPPIIRKISIDFAIYRLLGRRGLSIPEDRKARYDDGIRMLKDIQKGVATIGVTTPAPSAGSGAVSNKTASDRVFTLATTINF